MHYHFITPRDFERLRQSDALLEWAEVHDNFYGTPREPVEKALARRPRHALRHRLAGRVAGDRESARRCRQRLHPAAIDGGVEGAPAAPRRGQAGSDRTPARQCARRNPALARLRLCRDQRRSAARASAGAGDPRPPNGCAATAAPVCSSSKTGCWAKPAAPALTNSATLSVSARRSPSIPAFSSRAAPPIGLRLWRSILRRCPKAAAVSLSSARSVAGQGLRRAARD